MVKPNLIIENSLLKVRNSELIDENKKTYLSGEVTAASSTLTVENITSAALNGWIILGSIGSEKTEKIQINSVTAPSGTTITLATNTVFAHPSSTPVYFIDYNTVEFSHATTSGGTKTVLNEVSITPDSEFTQYSDTNTTGYTYARFNNSGVYSDYSEEQAYTHLAFNSIANIIDSVFNRANEKNENLITRKEVLFDYIWGFCNKVSEMRTKWNHEEAAEDISNTTVVGGETFSLPTDAKYSDKKAIQCISVEGYDPLKYISITEFRTKVSGIARTTLSSTVTAGDTTVNLINASNFPESGTGYISGDTFTWTGKTGNQLTGVSGVLDHVSGLVVYESNYTGLPEYYSIHNGIGKIYPAVSSDYDGIPLVIDYYKEVDRPTSENDLIPVKLVEACKDYCAMRVYQKKNDLATAKEFKNNADKAIVQAIKNERTGERGYLTTKE